MSEKKVKNWRMQLPTSSKGCFVADAEPFTEEEFKDLWNAYTSSIPEGYEYTELYEKTKIFLVYYCTRYWIFECAGILESGLVAIHGSIYCSIEKNNFRKDTFSELLQEDLWCQGSLSGPISYAEVSICVYENEELDLFYEKLCSI